MDQIGGSIIVAPSGEIVAACTTKGDEPALARCDLDLCNSFETTFNFDAHPAARCLTAASSAQRARGGWPTARP